MSWWLLHNLHYFNAKVWKSEKSSGMSQKLAFRRFLGLSVRLPLGPHKGNFSDNLLDFPLFIPQPLSEPYGAAFATFEGTCPVLCDAFIVVYHCFLLCKYLLYIMTDLKLVTECWSHGPRQEAGPHQLVSYMAEWVGHVGGQGGGVGGAGDWKDI